VYVCMYVCMYVRMYVWVGTTDNRGAAAEKHACGDVDILMVEFDLLARVLTCETNIRASLF
jgi:hypothetical protein